MKSQYATKFNHDPIATDYDNCIQNEDNPIRTGYQAMMQRIQDNTQNAKNIVDLGCGTGNTSQVISNFETLYCVDISQNMLNIAQRKLQNKKNKSPLKRSKILDLSEGNLEGFIFIQSDLLEFFDTFPNDKNIDTIISTYAIHHLTQPEKHKLFKKVYNFLPTWWTIVFWDLMFQNKAYKNQMKQKYPDLIEDFDDEFYRYLDDENQILKNLWFETTITKFSDLSRWIHWTKK